MEQKILSSLSIFIPLYHDEKTIAPLTEETIRIATELTDDFEIILIDDASPDGAGEVADRLANAYPEIRVIHHDQNRGVGPSMIEGYAESRKDYVYYTDGDAQYDVSELRHFAQYAREFDVIIGYRVKRAEGFSRLFTSRCFHLLASLLFGIRYRDIDCSFKLLHRRFMQNVQFYSQSALVDLELLIHADRLGHAVKELGVRHLPRRFGYSQCLRVKLILSMIADMVRLRVMHYRKGRLEISRGRGEKRQRRLNSVR